MIGNVFQKTWDCKFDTIIKGTCDKSRLLDLFENFILFDGSVGSVSKLVARNHQFIKNKAIEYFQATDKKQRMELFLSRTHRLGVFGIPKVQERATPWCFCVRKY